MTAFIVGRFSGDGSQQLVVKSLIDFGQSSLIGGRIPANIQKVTPIKVFFIDFQYESSEQVTFDFQI